MAFFSLSLFVSWLLNPFRNVYAMGRGVAAAVIEVFTPMMGGKHAYIHNVFVGNDMMNATGGAEERTEEMGWKQGKIRYLSWGITTTLVQTNSHASSSSSASFCAIICLMFFLPTYLLTYLDHVKKARSESESIKDGVRVTAICIRNRFLFLFFTHMASTILMILYSHYRSTKVPQK